MLCSEPYALFPSLALCSRVLHSVPESCTLFPSLALCSRVLRSVAEVLMHLLKDLPGTLGLVGVVSHGLDDVLIVILGTLAMEVMLQLTDVVLNLLDVVLCRLHAHLVGINMDVFRYGKVEMITEMLDKPLGIATGDVVDDKGTDVVRTDVVLLW